MADNDLLSTAEAKEVLDIGSSDTSENTKLARAVTAVSLRLDEACGPVVARTITDEAHQDTAGQRFLWVTHWPVTSFTTVTEYDATGTPTTLTAESVTTKPNDGYRPRPYSGLGAVYSGRIERRSSTGTAAFDAAVVLTYSAGRYANTAGVADVFKQAAGETLKAVWEGMPDIVTNDGLTMGRMRTFALPQSAMDLLMGEVHEPALFA